MTPEELERRGETGLRHFRPHRIPEGDGLPSSCGCWRNEGSRLVYVGIRCELRLGHLPRCTREEDCVRPEGHAGPCELAYVPELWPGRRRWNP